MSTAHQHSPEELDVIRGVINNSDKFKKMTTQLAMSDPIPLTVFIEKVAKQVAEIKVGDRKNSGFIGNLALIGLGEVLKTIDL